MFIPTQQAALDQLTQFIPNAGAHYAQYRNFDFGADRRTNVSTLSPYIRRRVISERHVLGQVLTQHSRKEAEKFIQEVFWRTYWKGWLELRPYVWREYRAALDRHLNDVQTQSGLRQRWTRACLGDTGIDCFDVWAKELVKTGYLHNHTRMWFASIWVFTLELPWELGADFFLRHLLDGDPASNTLSWRWVAGLHTTGKAYLATPDNIAKFTRNRFAPTGLTPALPRLPDFTHHAPKPLGPRVIPRIAGRVGVLGHDDDMDLSDIADLGQTAVSHAYVTGLTDLSPLTLSDTVTNFVECLAQDHAARTDGAPATILRSVSDMRAWAQRHALDVIVTPYAPVGPVADMLVQFERDDAQGDPQVVQIMTGYDARAWPKATHGFFRFKSHIDEFLDRIEA